MVAGATTTMTNSGDCYCGGDGGDGDENDNALAVT
jgi:hypothetical protein